jgi:hypothetical protein
MVMKGKGSRVQAVAFRNEHESRNSAVTRHVEYNLASDVATTVLLIHDFGGEISLILLLQKQFGELCAGGLPSLGEVTSHLVLRHSERGVLFQVLVEHRKVSVRHATPFVFFSASLCGGRAQRSDGEESN